MDLYESHPQEDSSVHALLIIGILKATAVLKSVKKNKQTKPSKVFHFQLDVELLIISKFITTLQFNCMKLNLKSLANIFFIFIQNKEII